MGINTTLKDGLFEKRKIFLFVTLFQAMFPAIFLEAIFILYKNTDFQLLCYPSLYYMCVRVFLGL